MSNDGGGSGCFSAVVRLLLCKGHLQTHPADHSADPIIDTNRNRSPFHKDCYFTCEEENEGIPIIPAPVAAPPGIVARLMGLESLPAVDSTNWRRSSAAARDAVTRSRSVSFVDYLLHLDLSSSSASFSNARHRRVRTSASFREEILAAQNNPDFFLLYLEDANKVEKSKREIGSNVIRKSEIGSTAVVKPKQRREEARIVRSKSKEKNNQKQNEEQQKKKVAAAVVVGTQKAKQSVCARGNRVSSSIVVGSVSQLKKKVHSHQRKCQVKPTANQKEVMVESNFMKKIKNQKPIATDGVVNSSETSVSSAISGKKRDTRKSCETEVTLSSPNLQQEVAAGGRFMCKPRPPPVNQLDTDRYVSELVEEDVKGTVWITKKSNGEVEYEWFEEMCVELGQQLLDLLLEELV